MKILFISNDLIGGNLALLLKKEGHSVKLFIEDSGRHENFDNLVTKTYSWKKELPWVGTDGLIVFDDVGYGEIQDDLRKKGYNVFGGSKGGDRLEQDRVFVWRCAALK
jgi:phosphoribosylamine--glycine ligase